MTPIVEIEDGPRLRADPLGLSNWQMTQKTAFDLHNKTGSDDEAGTGKFSAVPVLTRRA
jgi:hypothetical protein